MHCIPRYLIGLIVVMLVLPARPALADADAKVSYDVTWNSLGKNCNDFHAHW